MPAEPFSVMVLVDDQRTSYAEAARLYGAAFRAAGIPVRLQPAHHAVDGDVRHLWIVQCTIGPLLRPILDAHNVAIVFHEWDRYPTGWVRKLNGFQQVWAPSRHVLETLSASGVTAPLWLIPPPVAEPAAVAKSDWRPSAPFRFLTVGQLHFRKGVHLLLEGFLQAFPDPGPATLTLKLAEAPTWSAPFPHVRLETGMVERSVLLA